MKRIALLLVLVAVVRGEWEPIGPDGGYVFATGLDPVRPDTLYCLVSSADSFGVYRTTDHGASWSRAGLLGRDGAMNLVVDPFQPSTILGPTGSTFIQRSTNGGASWRQVSLPCYASVVAYDPFVPGRVYAAGMYYDTMSRPAFAVSTDHGASWSDRPVKDDTGGIYGIAPSPLASGVVYLSGDYGTVFRSTDAGQTWHERSGGLSPDDVLFGISVNHADSRVLLCGGIYGLFRSTDEGVSWHRAGGAQLVMSVDFSPADPAKGYAYGYEAEPVCYYTTDTGLTWQVTAPVQPSARLGAIVADRGLGNGVWCATASGMVFSTDCGRHWSQASSGIRTAAVAAMSVADWDPGRVYVAAEGAGVYRTLDAGDNWQSCSYFLSCGNICGIGLVRGPSEDIVWALEGRG
ncbi:hypothetical protein FJY69_03925 [candidate division WOR-3 bacterium]|nr:hypothetical protein [candidate division WOR-3 bacterium]